MAGDVSSCLPADIPADSCLPAELWLMVFQQCGRFYRLKGVCGWSAHVLRDVPLPCYRWADGGVKGLQHVVTEAISKEDLAALRLVFSRRPGFQLNPVPYMLLILLGNLEILELLHQHRNLLFQEFRLYDCAFPEAVCRGHTAAVEWILERMQLSAPVGSTVNVGYNSAEDILIALRTGTPYVWKLNRLPAKHVRRRLRTGPVVIPFLWSSDRLPPDRRYPRYRRGW